MYDSIVENFYSQRNFFSQDHPSAFWVDDETSLVFETENAKIVDGVAKLNLISESLEGGRKASFELDSESIFYNSYLKLVESFDLDPSMEQVNLARALERLSVAIREHNADASKVYMFNSTEALISSLQE